MKHAELFSVCVFCDIFNVTLVLAFVSMVLVRNQFITHADTSVFLVKFIANYIRDPSSVFSTSSLMRLLMTFMIISRVFTVGGANSG